MTKTTEDGAPETEGVCRSFGYAADAFDRKTAGAETFHDEGTLLEADDPRLADPAFRDGYLDEALAYARDNYGHELHLTLVRDLEEANGVDDALEALALLGHPIIVAHDGRRRLQALLSLSHDMDDRAVPEEILSRLADALAEVSEAFELLSGHQRSEEVGPGVACYAPHRSGEPQDSCMDLVLGLCPGCAETRERGMSDELAEDGWTLVPLSEVERRPCDTCGWAWLRLSEKETGEGASA